MIRSMRGQDIDQLDAGFIEQGWGSRREVLERYLREQEAGQRQVFVAEHQGAAAGYVTLLPEAKAGPFAGTGLPEISDFNVMEKYRRNGLGNQLLAAAEDAAAQRASSVTLGVGLHVGYGPAQRLYVKRGYVPDGSGVWYQDRRLAPYTPCMNNDSLAIYLSKDLGRGPIAGLKGLHHAAIIVSGYPAARAFYVDKLGLSVVRENYRPDREDWKLDLRCGDCELEIFGEKNPPARVTNPEACGLRHLAFRVEDAERAAAWLTGMGIPVEPIRVDPFTGKRTAFFRDPDGLPLELYEL